MTEELNRNIINEITTILNSYEELDIVKPDKLFDNSFFKEYISHLLYCVLSLPEYSNINYEHIPIINKIIENYLIKYVGIEESFNNDSINNYLESKIISLSKIPQPEQRTNEWYIFRNNRLTASDLFYVIDEYDKLSKKNYKMSAKYKELISKKCGIDIPFIKGAAINHGIKFEPIATSIYETRNNLTILEFGCLPHPHIPFFGASPDGIVSYSSTNRHFIGRMLEIKCPKSRPITGIIPKSYYAQMQGQLEVCDLEYCDFLECDFKFYNDEDSFFNDKDTNYTTNNEKLNFIKNKQGNEIGAIIEIFDTKLQKNFYHYASADILKNKNDFKLWEKQFIDMVFKNDNSHLEYIGTLYWYINKYNVVLVKRDREWFNNNYIKIEYFWDNVIKYRNNGEAETLIKKKKYEPFKTEELDFIN